MKKTIFLLYTKIMTLIVLLCFVGFIELIWAFSLSSSRQFVGYDAVNHTFLFGGSSIFNLFYYALYFMFLCIFFQSMINPKSELFFYAIKQMFLKNILFVLLYRIIINGLYLACAVLIPSFSISAGVYILLEIIFILLQFDLLNRMIAKYYDTSVWKRYKDCLKLKWSNVATLILLILCIIAGTLFFMHTMQSINNSYELAMQRYETPDVFYLQSSMKIKSNMLTSFILLITFLITALFSRAVNNEAIEKVKLVTELGFRTFCKHILRVSYSSGICFYLIVCIVQLPVVYPYTLDFLSGFNIETYVSLSDKALKNSGSDQYTVLNLVRVNRDYSTPKRKFYCEIPFSGNEKTVTNYFEDFNSKETSYGDVFLKVNELFLDFKDGRSIYVDFKSINSLAENASLTEALKVYINDGYFEILEMSTQYLLEYENEYAQNMLRKYASGEINPTFIHPETKVKEEYIKKFCNNYI